MKGLIIFSVILTAVLFGCASNRQTAEISQAEQGAYGQALPVTRGEAARMLALCLYTSTEIYQMENKADFKDVAREDRLYPYINAAVNAGVMAGDNDKFRSEDFLTVEEASFIINNADKTKRLKIDAGESAKTSPISYCIWVEILDKLSESGNTKNVEKREMTLLMTEYDNNSIQDYAITDKGLFKTDGFVGNNVEYCGCAFLVKENAIIAISEVTTLTPALNKALVLKSSSDKTEIFSGGCTKVLKGHIEGKLPLVADITIEKDTVKESAPYTAVKQGRVLSVNSQILFDDDFSYNTDENFFVYSTYNGIQREGKTALLSGSNADVVFSQNKAICAIVKEEPKSDKIRINITSPRGTATQNSIKITCTDSYKIKSGTKETDFDKNSIYELNNTEGKTVFGGKRAVVTTNGSLTVNGKNCGGSAEIIITEDGYSVVRETELEEYLWGVVCAEMPSSYHIEALKAQAVAARSYAYKQRQDNSKLRYGANIDDTTAFQVYNPSTVCDEAKKAVKATENQYITYNGEIIKANFYSTSCGTGANSGEIWGNGSIYPASTPKYLSCKSIGGSPVPDFDNEAAALAFFKSKDENALEADFPYYRWSFETDGSTVNNAKGKVNSITVTKRGVGGNVMELAVSCENGDITITGENAVRSFINPNSITLQNGATASFKSLPSTFFAIERQNGKFCFYGGGYGHGVGMSQNGAQALALKGKNYKYILEYFFSETKVNKQK